MRIKPVKTVAEPVMPTSLRRVKLSDLKGASHNPKSRTDVKSNKMRQIVRNIEEIGLIYPIAVDKDMTIIDGHRRATACRTLGWEHVPVIVVPNENATAVYAGVNANAEMMNGLQVLQVYLQEPEAVSDRARRALDRYSEAFGRQALKNVAKAKLSYHTLGKAERIARYVDDLSTGFLDKALNYLLRHRNGRIVTSYMTLKQPPQKLYQAIMRDKELELQFA